MPRQYSFELFYPADQVPAALDALSEILTPIRRKRTHKPIKERDWNLSRLTPDSPIFLETSLLFPADKLIRAFHAARDAESEWTEEGVECLPVGAIRQAIRVGVRYALLSFTASTGGISDLFRDSPAVWGQFAALLRSSGGLAGLYSGVDHRGIARYPLLPDGREAVELDFFDFVLEERDTYWHIDTDRYAAEVLQAPRVAGRTVRCS
jgi:hypothetical protein